MLQFATGNNIHNGHLVNVCRFVVCLRREKYIPDLPLGPVSLFFSSFRPRSRQAVPDGITLGHIAWEFLGRSERLRAHAARRSGKTSLGIRLGCVTVNQPRPGSGPAWWPHSRHLPSWGEAERETTKWTSGVVTAAKEVRVTGHFPVGGGASSESNPTATEEKGDRVTTGVLSAFGLKCFRLGVFSGERLPVCVHAPSKFTIFSWFPRCVIILSSDMRASLSELSAFSIKGRALKIK